MTNNKLKLSNVKTGIMQFGTKALLDNASVTSLAVSGTRVHVSNGPVINLGIIPDNSACHAR